MLPALLLLTAAVASAAAKPLCPGCSILLVSFDALQAAHVHALGYPRPVTPTIDELAARGALFKQAVSAASWTVPSHMSWFTSASPSRHGVVNKFASKGVVADLRRISPQMTTLARALKAAGYATAGFTGDAGVNGMFGFNEGFDVYSDSVPAFSGFDRSAPEAARWLRGHKDGPFFLFLHGYDVHGQHLPAGGYDRRFVDRGYAGPYDGSPAQQRDLRERGLAGEVALSTADVAFWRALYDEKVARADAEFSAFMSSFTELGVSSRTVIVLASDHGTELYEHRKLDHGATLYDELVRVLLVIDVPGAPRGVVVERQVSMLDLMPTLLDVVGIEPSQPLRRQMEGRALTPALRGGAIEGEDAYIETDYRLYTHKRALRDREGLKLIYTVNGRSAQLYDVRSDPGETEDLARSRPRQAYELEQKLFSHYKTLGSDLDETDLSLGCLPVYNDQCR